MAEKKEEKRERVLAAGREVVLQVGIARLTLEDVALKLGMSVSSLYYYFANKQELLEAILDAEVEHLIAVIEQAVEEVEGPEKQLLNIGRRLVGELETLRSHPGYNQENARRAEEMIPGPLRRLRKAHRRVLQKVLADGVAKGVFALEDIELTSYILVAGTYGVVQTMLDPDSPQRLLTDRTAIENLLMNGLKKR